jgi:DNA helicase-2/ATP-dependent DNA helicase PcrA
MTWIFLAIIFCVSFLIYKYQKKRARRSTKAYSKFHLIRDHSRIAPIIEKTPEPNVTHKPFTQKQSLAIDFPESKDISPVITSEMSNLKSEMNESLANAICKKEDREETEDLLQRFRNTFLLVPPSHQDISDYDNIATISIDRYNQPEPSVELQQKIARLQSITNSIENNLVKVSDKKDVSNKLKIAYSRHLNEMQYIATTTIMGPLLVIAGAGTGKTRAIVYRVAFLLENDIPPQQILLLTFTRKAANEMLKRISFLLNDLRCQKVMGGTFHSFANYLLRKYANFLNIPSNFTIIDTVDSEDTIDLIRHELHFEKGGRAFPKKHRIYSIISKARNSNISIKAVIEHEYSGIMDFLGDIEIIMNEYANYKKTHNLFDYDDLMEFLRDSLRSNLFFREKVQESFRYIMVDEFQDTNTIQKEIVDLIAERHRNIMVVGDDSQSIYSFRGANYENILRFAETYPDCKFIKIEENYRSNQDILSFTNSIINNAKIGYKKRLYSSRTGQGIPIFKKFYSQENEAEFIVSKILEMREREIPLDQVAVLYRATFHGNYVQAELLKKKIPYVVYGGIRFIERRHVKDLIAYLRIILNPLDPVSWNRVLKLIPGIGNITAGKIVLHLKSTKGKIDFSSFTEKKYSPDLTKLANILNQVSKKEISIAAKIQILREYYSPLLERTEDDYEMRLLDIDVLYNLARQYDDLETFLSDFALEPPSNKYQDRTTPQINESEDKPVILSTVHSAKGLEWKVVFILHLIDGLFPSANSLVDIEDLEEERRLFYVACTRAKDQLYLTMPSYASRLSGICTLPSRFLVEVEKEKYQTLL